MNYDELQQAYDDFLAERAAQQNMSVAEYLDDILHNCRINMHTLEVAELVKGYGLDAEQCLQLAQEGFVDIDGD